MEVRDEMQVQIDADIELVVNWVRSVDICTDLGQEIIDFYRNSQKLFNAGSSWNLDINTMQKVKNENNWPFMVLYWWLALSSPAYSYDSARAKNYVPYSEGHSGSSFAFVIGRSIYELTPESERETL